MLRGNETICIIFLYELHQTKDKKNLTDRQQYIFYKRIRSEINENQKYLKMVTKSLIKHKHLSAWLLCFPDYVIIIVIWVTLHFLVHGSLILVDLFVFHLWKLKSCIELYFSFLKERKAGDWRLGVE